MKKIIAGILRRGYTASKQATLKNCIAFLYPLQYILEETPAGRMATVRCNHNPFWGAENNQRRAELIHDILDICKPNITDGSYFHIINRFEHGDRYGIILPTEAPTKQFIYRIDEDDADGCGTDIYVYARFNRELNADMMRRLSQIFESVKPDADTGDVDFDTTEEIIAVALTKFQEETGVGCEICETPLAGVISF